MVQSSAAFIFNGLIHLAAFFLSCFLLFSLLKSSSQITPRKLVFRVTVVVALLSVSQLVFLATSMPLGLVIVVLLILALPVVYIWLKPPISLAVIASVITVFLLLFIEQTAIRLAAMVPGRAALVEDVGLETRQTEASQETPLTNSHPEEVEVHRIEESVDFYDVYMERRYWMENLSHPERQRYCEETAAFLVAEGFSGDEYSVGAIQTVDQVNLIELVAFFNELLSDTNKDASLDLTLDHLVGISLTDGDIEMLTVFVGLCVRRDMERAMAIARAELQALHGESEFVATVLLAMVQAGTGYPIDLLLAEQPRSGPMTHDRINQLASNHWSRVGVQLEPSEQAEEVAPVAEESLVRVEEPVVVKISEALPKLIMKPAPKSLVKPVIAVKPEPFQKITTNLGIVYVPDDERLINEWIVAANSLEIRGYVALGEEIVILRMDGAMLRKDQDWVHEMKGYHYRFKLEDIQRDMVTIRASGRELIR